MRVERHELGAWFAPIAAAIGLLALALVFARELRDYQRSVIGWAERDLRVRTELAASTLAEPLRTSDFRRIHAFGDACAKDGVRLTVLTGSRGVFFDSRRQGAAEPAALFVEQPCGEFRVRLGLPYARVLAPVNRARRGFVLAGCLGGLAVLIVFFFTYRQRVRIRELARLEKFRREFISDVSHEIKTPLTGILGAVDLLESQLGEATSPSLLLGLLRKEATRLNALVQSILDLARLERSDRVLNPTDTDLSALATELAEEQGVAAHVAPGVTVRCDAQLIAQAILNLIVNAKRHSGTTDIAVSLAPAKGGVEIAVEDHGIGIPSEERERVFERFHRVDPARAAESGGAGLGLAIVRSIARLHGGDATLIPAHPTGCRFVLSLPCR